MLRITAPTPVNGDLLEKELADAGLPSRVTLVGSEVVLDGLDEAEHLEAKAVLDAHPASAEAALAAGSARVANQAAIYDRAAQALDANAAFLALSSPTNAQNAAQVKALTRQVNGLIRLVLGRLDGTD